MLFERIASPGLAHYSYLAGDRHEAVVIDPRRDAEIYVERAAGRGYRLTHALETHRHEDFLVGSLELEARTGCQVWHAERELAYAYGQPASDRQTWPVGRLRLQALHTPGHTPGHLSYLLHDPEGQVWLVFTGDALFAGDVGRVDLFGAERMEELAGLLYESLQERILPLGDGVIVCPAHGAGSVCGAAIAERPWTTVGLERRLNPRLLQPDRAAFVANVAQALELPPYFRRVEELNVAGPPVLGCLPAPAPLPPADFARAAEQGTVVDTRSIHAFAAAHVPGALSIWLDGVPRFAGWFLPYDRPLLLVCDGDPTAAVRHLVRLGYDRPAGYLAGGMLDWHKAGRQSDAIKTITVQGLCRRLDAGADTWIIDVRSHQELASEGRLPGAHHVHITQLGQHLAEVPRGRPVFIFCGSGLRSMIGASLLQREGWPDLTVVLGGFAGWVSRAYPIERGSPLSL